MAFGDLTQRPFEGHPNFRMKKKEIKTELGKIVDEMTKLEVEMARGSYQNGATKAQVADWVVKSSALSSKLDKIWKNI